MGALIYISPEVKRYYLLAVRALVGVHTQICMHRNTCSVGLHEVAARFKVLFALML